MSYKKRGIFFVSEDTLFIKKRSLIKKMTYNLIFFEGIVNKSINMAVLLVSSVNLGNLCFHTFETLKSVNKQNTSSNIM